MEQQIQCLRTPDGVSLAYSAVGEGRPLVLLPLPPFTHLQGDWTLSQCRGLYEILGAGRRLVRYDARGSGLSSHEVADISLEAQLRDLEALVNRLELRDLDLFAASHAGPVALAYAARHPERVARLLLWCVPVRGSEYVNAPLFPPLLGLMEQDWELFAETAAHAWFGWSHGEAAHQAAPVLAEIVTPDLIRSVFATLRDFDVAPLLPRVHASVLLLHSAGFRAADIGWARELASGLPNARLLILDGASGSPAMSDLEQVLQAIDEFPSEDEVSPAASEPAGLSGREVEVLRLVAGGCSNKEIAQRLILSTHTVERHLVNIYRKIDARGRADATAFALHHGLE